MMSIDHLEGYCKYKKLQYSKYERPKCLNYDAVSMRSEFKNIVGNFDDYG